MFDIANAETYTNSKTDSLLKSHLSGCCNFRMLEIYLDKARHEAGKVPAMLPTAYSQPFHCFYFSSLIIPISIQVSTFLLPLLALISFIPLFAFPSSAFAFDFLPCKTPYPSPSKDDRDGKDVCGWWFGPSVGGDMVREGFKQGGYYPENLGLGI